MVLEYLGGDTHHVKTQFWLPLPRIIISCPGILMVQKTIPSILDTLCLGPFPIPSEREPDKVPHFFSPC